MRGQWISQTRRLNKHYQSGGEVPDDYWSSFCSGSFGDVDSPSGTVVSYLGGTKWVWDNDLRRYRMSNRNLQSAVAVANINQTAFIQSAHMYRSAPGAYEMTAYATNIPSPPASPSVKDDYPGTAGGNSGIRTFFFGHTANFSRTADVSGLWRGMKWLKMTCPEYGYRKVNGVLQPFPANLDAIFDMDLLGTEMSRLMADNTNAARNSTRQVLSLYHVTYWKSGYSAGTWTYGGSGANIMDENSTHGRRTNHYTKWMNYNITELLFDVSGIYNVQQQFRGTSLEGRVAYVGLKMFLGENDRIARTFYWSVVPSLYDSSYELLSDEGIAEASSYDMHFFFDGIPVALLRMCPGHPNTNIGDIEYASGENGSQQTTFTGRYRAFVVPRVDGVTKEEFEAKREEVDPQLRTYLYTAPT